MGASSYRAYINVLSCFVRHQVFVAPGVDQPQFHAVRRSGRGCSKSGDQHACPRLQTMHSLTHGCGDIESMAWSHQRNQHTPAAALRREARRRRGGRGAVPTVVALAVIVHHLVELLVNNSQQSRTNPTDLVNLFYGSSSNLERDQRIATGHPRHHESRGGGSIRSAIGSDSARGSRGSSADGSGEEHAALNQATATESLDLTIPTDNRPFFFNQLRFADIPRLVTQTLRQPLQTGVLRGTHGVDHAGAHPGDRPYRGRLHHPASPFAAAKPAPRQLITIGTAILR